MFCSKKLKEKFENDLNPKVLNDEAGLMYKIISAYSNNRSLLYELLTGKKYLNLYIFLEA